MLSTNDRSTVPLTPEERMWLRANSVLPVVSLLGVVGVAAMVGSADCRPGTSAPCERSPGDLPAGRARKLAAASLGHDAGADGVGVQ